MLQIQESLDSLLAFEKERFSLEKEKPSVEKERLSLRLNKFETDRVHMDQALSKMNELFNSLFKNFNASEPGGATMRELPSSEV